MASTLNHFWRRNPLSGKETELFHLVMEAHYESADRGNISATGATLAACGSGDYSKSIAAALMCIGGPHGPIEQTVKLLSDTESLEKATAMLVAREKVPGWGNSFERGHDDPVWNDVREFLEKNYENVWWKVREITKMLQDHGKNLFPNPSAYTAVAAIILGIPASAACYLFIAGRLPAWTRLFLNTKPA